ncbi:hypothetical protein D3C85_1166500 [compost metagenome]
MVSIFFQLKSFPFIQASIVHAFSIMGIPIQGLLSAPSKCSAKLVLTCGFCALAANRVKQENVDSKNNFRIGKSLRFSAFIKLVYSKMNDWLAGSS